MLLLKIGSETHSFYFFILKLIVLLLFKNIKEDKMPAYIVYQKNKGQGHDCFLAFFRPTNSKKIFKYFFRNLSLKIQRLTKFHEKKN
jgi:hypothetical protein